MGELDGVTVVVTGTARGFGRAVEEAMVEAGAEVVGVLGAGACGGEELLRLHRPELLVITSTSVDGVDRRLDPIVAFDWAAAALRVAASGGGRPATVFAVSGESVESVESVELIGPMKSVSSLELTGPAGVAHSMEPLAAYVAWEARRTGVGLRFVCVVVPPGDEGRLVRRFQGRAEGIRRSAWSDVRALVAGLRPVLTELELGSELVRLAALATRTPPGRSRKGSGDGERLAPSYRLGADGLVPDSGPKVVPSELK